MIKASKKVREYKKACEANIVSILYKSSELYYDYSGLKLEDFSENVWKVFYQIGYDIIIKENKKLLDEITIGLYLEKHQKLKEQYDKYGGYATIENAKAYVKVENIDGYINELHKWSAVLDLLVRKFPIYDNISEFVDKSAEEIYDQYEAMLNHIFSNTNDEVKSYNLCENVHALLDKLNAGESVGLPLHNSEILNKEIGGNLNGNMTMFGALSGAGKTTTTIEWILPSVIDYDEKLVIMINEEDADKWRKELIIWVANNIYKKEFPKYKLRDGNFCKDSWEILKKCADWIESKKDKNIIIIPFQKYRCSLAMKIIKKYASMGVKYFILDTFKASAEASHDQIWQSMIKDSVDLYDTIKPASKNVHLWLTFQLGKQSTKQKYYTMDNIGQSKNTIDVASTCIMIRKVFDDEFEGGKNELTCYRMEGKNKKTKIPFKLKRDKSYSIIFIVKNRFGATNEYQIVAENNLSTNVYKELGIVNIPLDW